MKKKKIKINKNVKKSKQKRRLKSKKKYIREEALISVDLKFGRYCFGALWSSF
jgi:hypothetical protein